MPDPEEDLGGSRERPATTTAPRGEAAAVESPVPGGAPQQAADPSGAWTRWLESGRGVPRGLGPFLRSSVVRAVEDGSIEVVPPSGPAVERLREADVLAEVAQGLLPFLGREVSVSVAPPSDDAPAPDSRVSTEAVRKDTLKALYRKEPRLERAVEELDLELLD
ncbi:MAG: hypothetical protein P8170_23295 [Gemmatimonadota bacterium]